jgi:hypothetical protein
MPEPGQVCPGFMAEVGRCWRMVYDHNLQATHCLHTELDAVPSLLSEASAALLGCDEAKALFFGQHAVSASPYRDVERK